MSACLEALIHPQHQKDKREEREERGEEGWRGRGRKNSHNLTHKKINNPIFKKPKDLNQNIFQDDKQIGQGHSTYLARACDPEFNSQYCQKNT
jgi:hypothetical protein